MPALLRALLPAAASGGSDLEAALRALAAAQQGAAPAHAPGAPEAGGGERDAAAVLSPAAAGQAAVPLGVNYVFWSGRLHPLLEEEGGGGHYILVPEKMAVTGSCPGVATRFVRLPPAQTMPERLAALRDLRAVVEPVSLGDLADLGGRSTYMNGARRHLIMPNGLVLPVWWNDTRKQYVKHPALRRALGLGGEEDGEWCYSVKDLQVSGSCAHVYLA